MTDSTAVALVTGAASGIGRATARRLAAAGHPVALLDSDGAGVGAAAESLGPQAIAVAVDVAVESDVTAAVHQVVDRLGEPAILVNCAGILTHVPFRDLSAAEWRRLLDINVTGTFHCTQAVVRRLLDQGRPGVVINVTSVHADSPGTGLAHYDASKGALRMLTKSLALELAPHQIRVNAVAPGLVMTNLAGGVSDELRERMEKVIPLGRAGQPDDIAGVIAFLCSDDAAYMTGSTVLVDGGMLLTAQT